MNGKPYTVYNVEAPAQTGRWKRALLWTALALGVIVLVGAGGTYLWLDRVVNASQNSQEVSDVIEVIKGSPSTDAASASAVPDDPTGQNILVLGSDKREEGDEQETYGRSDTLMIVHVDPQRDFISLLSVPRDLRVEVPEYGLQKINAAYAYGGAALAAETVQNVTGIDLDHYINIDFQAFKDITTELGGIYVDVDRQYWYQGLDYENINIKAGYQALAGEQALDWVRFRHDQNIDFGRIERQQRFLRAAKDQAMQWDLFFKLPKIVSLLFSNVQTDLDTNDLLELAYWGVKLRGSSVRQVMIKGDTQTIDEVSYVIADDETILRAVDDFLTPPGEAAEETGVLDEAESPTVSTGESTTTSAGSVDLSGVTVDVLNGNGRTGEAAAAGAWLTSLGATVGRVDDADDHREITRVSYPVGKAEAADKVAAAVGAEDLVEVSGLERITVILGDDFELPDEFIPPATPETIPDSGYWKSIALKVPFTVMGPAFIPDGYDYKGLRIYDLSVGDSAYPAVKYIYRFGEEDQYLGIMETTWTDAPAAGEGEEVRGANGLTYTLVMVGNKVDHVWWMKDGVLYWVSNTLSYNLDRWALLKMAESMIAIPGPTG